MVGWIVPGHPVVSGGLKSGTTLGNGRDKPGLYNWKVTINGQVVIGPDQNYGHFLNRPIIAGCLAGFMLLHLSLFPPG
jgi:hypothetical protein